MRILTYKRTHKGDPDRDGRFGINDCMGRIRELDFDAVIGIGGIGHEPRSFGIEGKINWIGFKPRKRQHPDGCGVLVQFEKFAMLEQHGPILQTMAPLLARRMYKQKARYLLTGYSRQEQVEAESIVKWFLKQLSTPGDQHDRTDKESDCNRGCRPVARSRKLCNVT